MRLCREVATQLAQISVDHRNESCNSGQQGEEVIGSSLDEPQLILFQNKSEFV